MYGDPSGLITRDGLEKPDLSRKHLTDAYQNLARSSNLSQGKAFSAVMAGSSVAGGVVPGGNTTLIVAAVAGVAIVLYLYAR